MIQRKVKIYLLLTYAFWGNTCFGGYAVANEMSFLIEKCYIENNYVLLYKITNWWNDSQPEEDIIVCGKALKCESKGISHIQYNTDDHVLTIVNDSNLEDLISVFKPCQGCLGPSYLKCTYLNDKYFKSQTLENALILNDNINIIAIQNVSYEEATKIINIENNITIILEGIIGGLLRNNSKIALHRAGSFLKLCPQSSENQEINLIIKNTLTGEILIKYAAVFD